MKLGDIVVETPTLLTLEVENGKQYYTPLPGKVVFIHPEKRFYTVEFYFKENYVRECFFFPEEQKEEGRDHARNRYNERKRRRWKNRHRRKSGGDSGQSVRKKGSVG